MVVKVCGIKTRSNIEMLSNIDIDMVGLNFYPPSVRYVLPDTDASSFDMLPSTIKKVGVFVNEDRKTIDSLAAKYKLDYIQLHGDESLEFAQSIADSYGLIKVFRIGTRLDIKAIRAHDFADFFIFDTATKEYGGSGKQFNWNLLEKYVGETPFLLSGGIAPEDINKVNQYSHPKFAGIDINSRFESSPGIKSEELLKPFVQKIKYVTNS